MRNDFCHFWRSFLPAALALLLLLTGCASVPEQMTQAAIQGNTADLEALIKTGAPEINKPALLAPDQTGCQGQRWLTPLQAAACAGQDAALRKLLAGKADINFAPRGGQAPLILAINHRREQAARLLIEAGAQLEVKDSAGNTPLLLAISQGNRPLAEFLLKHGASPKAKNATDESALFLSSDPALARMLTALGANPQALNSEGESGLHQAARTGQAAMARFFLEQGVDVTLRNRSGLTALELARSPSADDRQQTAGNRQATIAAKRRLPAARMSRAAAQAPELAQNRAEVASVIKEWIDRAVKQQTGLADLAARESRTAEALSGYTAALPLATQAGGTTENELRLKIIRYASSQPQPFGLPEKAREHLVRSAYLLKKGQDISLVENEITTALLLAPWWAEGYYNLGQIQAERGKFDVAERNLKLFIDSSPADPRLQAAQDKIYEIRMAREENEKIRGMQGRWTDANGRGYSTTVQGDKIMIRSDNGLAFTLTLRNGTLEGSVEGGSYPGGHNCTIPGQMHPVTGRLAPDARSMTLDYLWSRYQTRHHCVNMAGVPSNCCLLCDKVCDAVTVNGTDKVSLQLKLAR